MVYRRPSKSSQSRAKVHLRNRHERSWKRRENFLRTHVLEFVEELEEKHKEQIEEKEKEIDGLKNSIVQNKRKIDFLNERLNNAQRRNLDNSHRYEELLEDLRNKVLDKEEEIEKLNKKVSRLERNKGHR
jgi:predicted  nucleic acid-binding Zn-ribbon protein